MVSLLIPPLPLTHTSPRQQGVLHRNINPASLQLLNTNELKIAEFMFACHTSDRHGVAWPPDDRGRCYGCYVAPEILLNARQYGGEVDLWSAGCVLGEMLIHQPVFTGTDELDQPERTWHFCGTPDLLTRPDVAALPGCHGGKDFHSVYGRTRGQTCERLDAETADLLDLLLTCNPRERISACDALKHDYFPKDLPPANPVSASVPQRARPALRALRTRPMMARGAPIHSSTTGNAVTTTTVAPQIPASVLSILTRTKRK
jgi:serine/threonine-protein kinase BUR1